MKDAALHARRQERHSGVAPELRRPHGAGGTSARSGAAAIKFEEIIRALNHIGYTGPLSVEWEDSGMDREHGAREACAFVRKIDFARSTLPLMRHLIGPRRGRRQVTKASPANHDSLLYEPFYGTEGS